MFLALFSFGVVDAWVGILEVWVVYAAFLYELEVFEDGPIYDITLILPVEVVGDGVDTLYGLGV